MDTSNFDAVDEEASGDDQASSQGSGGAGGGGAGGSSGGGFGTFGLTSAPHAFPDFTFKRFFDQDNNNSNPSAAERCSTFPTAEELHQTSAILPPSLN